MASVKASIDVNGKNQHVIVLESPWNISFELRTIPGVKYVGSRQRYEMPLSWSSCILLRAVFERDIEIAPELKEWAWDERTRRIDPAMKIRDVITDVEDGDAFFEYDSSNDHNALLYPFQRVGSDFLVAAEDALLGDEQGTGKTIQVLAALRKTGAYPAIVVCPNSVKRNWEAEVIKWLPEATPIVIHGSAKQKRESLARWHTEKNPVVIINIESMRMFSRLAPYGGVRLVKCTDCDKYGGNPNLKSKASCESHPKELNELFFRTCVLDEAHRVKDPSAKQTRAIWSVFHGSEVRYRWALTGTPLANHPGDVWAIMHAVAPQDFPTRAAFIDRYALQSWNAFGSMDIVGLRQDTRDEFFKIFHPRFRRMQKSIVLPQLPPKVRTIRLVEMTPKQRKAYKELADELVTRLDDGSLLIARNNLAAATRLLQLSSSYCNVDRGETPEDPATWNVEPVAPSPKVDELLEIVKENSDHSIAVAAEHKKLINLAAEKLASEGITAVCITGDVDADERARNLRMFQEGKAQVILFTYKAGGVGLTMNRADILVRLQRSWSLIDNMQGEDRVHRIGSEVHESVNIIDLVADDTIEVQQCLRLHQKSQRMEEIVRDREQLVKHGASTAAMDEELERLENAFLGE